MDRNDKAITRMLSHISRVIDMSIIWQIAIEDLPELKRMLENL